MDPSHSIRTSKSGRQAAAHRDNRHAKGNAPTEPMVIGQNAEVYFAMLDALQEVARVYNAHGFGIHRIAGPKVMAAITRATGSAS